MNAAIQLPLPAAAPAGAPQLPRLALLGTGTVGAAFAQRYQRLRERIALPPLALIANSRIALECDGEAVLDALESACIAALPPKKEEATKFALPPPLKKGDTGGFALAVAEHAAEKIPPSPPFSKGGDGTALRVGDIVVDATASDAIASWHAPWLARGIHVVTANKLGGGAGCERAHAIASACMEGRAHYGDAATVGAGLPLLRSIRELRAGGDRIHAVEGVLSGSLAWLFDRFDGMRPFSGFVREARAAGYTEPDPRIDLCGEDVRRKLLILARAAGLALEAHTVQVESLVPAALAVLDDADVDANLALLDAPLRRRFQAAYRDGARLRFVGRFEATETGCRASVGLRALPAEHALCGGSGTDNRVAIRSDRYPVQPLLIQGPGAGADVTAAALIDDVIRCAAGFG